MLTLKGNALTRSPGSWAKHVTAKYSMMFHNYVYSESKPE